MAANCPHCQGELQAFVTQTEHTARLKAKDDAIAAKDAALKQSQGEVSALRTKAEAHDAAVAERDTARAQLAEREERDQRNSALDEAKVPPGAREGFAIYFRAEMAGKPEGERKDFGTWLKEDAAANPFLAPHLAATPADAKAPGDKKAAAPPARPGIAGDPPRQAAKRTPAQVQEFLASEAYRKLSREDQRKKLAEIEAETKGAQVVV